LLQGGVAGGEHSAVNCGQGREIVVVVGLLLPIKSSQIEDEEEDEDDDD